jgi:vacuolar-type H+-ATPase subunit E/Vma4
VSVDALLIALRKNQEQQIADIWQEAETEAAVYNRQTEEALREIRADFEKRLNAARLWEQGKMQRLLQHRKRQRRLHSEQRLAARLQACAEQMLSSLRDEGYPEVFAALVKELPGREWDTVRVNPADVALARACLPEVTPVGDAAIVGGLVVSVRDGTVRVDSTFAKRLENIWPVLMQEMVRDIYEKAQNIEDPQTKQTERIPD